MLKVLWCIMLLLLLMHLTIGTVVLMAVPFIVLVAAFAAFSLVI